MEVVGPKWEDLNMDCLVNICARVGLETLSLDVPYVCKLWYKANCNPQCWSILHFDESLFKKCLPNPYGLPGRSVFVNRWNRNSSSLNKFIKFAAKRGNNFATYMKLPDCCTKETLVFISNEYPNLQTLKLPRSLASELPSLVCKWKRLKHLSFPYTYSMQEIFEQIILHCKDFETLEVLGAEFWEENVSALSRLPNLKSLSIRSAEIEKVDLLMILKGCKRLEYLDARDCIGFEENDVEILDSAAHIHSVKLQHSRRSSYMDLLDELNLY